MTVLCFSSFDQIILFKKEPSNMDKCNMDKYFKKRNKTKKQLKDAFFEVSKEKNLSSINVKEICEAAGVGRSTFYINYENIEHFLREIASEILNDIEVILLSSQDKVSNEKTRNEIEQLHKYLYDNRQRILPFIYPQEIYYFANKFKSIMKIKLEQLNSISPFYRDPHINVFMNIGITGTMFYWLIHQNMNMEEFLRMSIKINKSISDIRTDHFHS